MKRDRTSIAEDLDALREVDFDEDDPDAVGMERLAALCDELSETCTADEISPLLFGFIERLNNAYLGSPGPVVHTLEKKIGYERYLRESVRRNPTSLTLWMANRIGNARRPDREEWVRLIEEVAGNVEVAGSIREEAKHFARRQRAA